MSGLVHELCLRRTVTVELWHVSGVIAVGAARPVELSLCELARERDIDVTAVTDDLVDRPQLARRLLAVCSRLGLLSDNNGRHRLTDQGRVALERGSVFLPEERRWEVAIVDDPLLPGQLLTVRRLEERAVKAGALTALPRWLRTTAAAPLRPLMDAFPVRVDSLAGQGVRVDSARIVVELSIDDDSADVFVSGKIGDHSLGIGTDAPPLRFPEVWQALVDGAGLGGRWDAQQELLRVGFDDVNDDEVEALARRQSFRAPALDGLGAFDSIEHVVPLAPASAPHAARWALERTLRRLRGHVADDAALAAVFAEAATPFSSFKLPSPTLPEVLPFARGDRAKPPSAAWWWLQAGRDLVGGAS